MRIYWAATVLSLLLLVTCKDKEEYILEEEVHVDSFVLNNINMESGISFYPSDTDLLISYVSNGYDKVFFYSLSKNTFVDSARFDIMDVSQQYYVDQNKNTYIFNTEANTLLIRDSTGNKRYVYKRNEFTHNGIDTFRRTYAAICMPLQVINNTIVLNNLRGYHIADKNERALYYSKENLTCLKIENDSLVKMNELANFPGFYHSNYINEFWPVAVRAGHDYVYALFNNDNVLYKYNLVTGSTDTLQVHGLDHNKTVPYNIDKITDIAYSTEYETKISSYLRLLHDEKLNRFVIFQMLPVNASPKDGMLSLYEDKPMLLNIIDSTMHVKRKIRFKDHIRFNLRYAGYYDNKLYIVQRFSTGDNKSSLKMYVIDTRQ